MSSRASTPSLRATSLSVLTAGLLALGCGSSPTRVDAGRPRPDGGVPQDTNALPIASCVVAGECAEYHDFFLEELGTFQMACMGDWALEPCDPDTVVGGCRTDDLDGMGYYIQWFLSPGTTESGARHLCDLAMREFVPPPP